MLLFFHPRKLGRRRYREVGAPTSAALLLRERFCVYAKFIAGYVGEFDEIGEERSECESVGMDMKIGVTHLSSATLARLSGLLGSSKSVERREGGVYSTFLAGLPLRNV